jgi:hypothetical protein
MQASDQTMPSWKVSALAVAAPDVARTMVPIAAKMIAPMMMRSGRSRSRMIALSVATKHRSETEFNRRGDANAGVRDRFNVGVLEEGLNEPEAEAQRKHAARETEGAAAEQESRRDGGGGGGDPEAHDDQHEGAERARPPSQRQGRRPSAAP